MLFIEQRGKTIHLLKAGSKPATQERKRRKIEILATPAQYHQMPEEQKQEEKADEIMHPTYGTNTFIPPKMPTRPKHRKPE